VRISSPDSRVIRSHRRHAHCDAATTIETEAVMNGFVAVVFPDEVKANQGLQALKELHEETSVTVYGMIVVRREANGTLTIKREKLRDPLSPAVGAVVGALIGLFGGPAGILVGLGCGAAIGAIHAEVTDEFIEDLARELRPGSSALIAEVVEDWPMPIDARMEKLGGKVVRESRRGFVEHLVEMQADAGKAELSRLKAQRATAKAEKSESQLEAQINELAAKLQRTADGARKRLEDARAEMDRKLKALEQQAEKARPDVRDRIGQRIAEIRKGFGERELQLTHAYEITQQALRA
jgi:uncharacterized membrane protein